MKKTRFLVIVIVIAALLVLSTAVFAAPAANDSPNVNVKQSTEKCEKIDPIKKIEGIKTKIQKALSDGKISKDDADKAIQKIDKKIKDLKDFNKLTPVQKKEKLINEFTSKLNSRVKNGKMTQEEADKAIADFKVKIQNWDGQGYPPFGCKGFKGHLHKDWKD